jgi:putative hydrolase of the HAD superfamily
LVEPAPAPPIRAIVCDFGGVLTTPLVESFLAMQEDIGVSVEEFGAAMRAVAGDGDIPLFALERGQLSEADFLELLGTGFDETLGRRPHLHGFGELFIGGLKANAPMIDLMRDLRGEGYRMAMLTNNVKEWEPHWRPMLPVDEIFELVVDSAFVGMRKPEPGIFALTVERIGLPAAECLLVDDMELNIEAAREFGMRTVHYREPGQAIADVRAALG